METQDPATVVRKTKNWLEKTVIGLNLCPFAKAVHVKNQIHYHVSMATDTETLLSDLISALTHLTAADPLEIDTSLLIHPEVLQDFLDYNDFLDVVDLTLIEMKLVGQIQVASFHPQYQFAGTQSEDAENYTNRSPYPMLHLLREASVEKAIASHQDATSIPDHNIETLRNLDAKSFAKLKSLVGK